MLKLMPRPYSDYSAKVFGFATFGKVYGLIICLAGLFNFSQSVLDALTHKVFGNDPTPVNLILLAIAIVVGSALVTFVWRRSNKTAKAGLRAEAEAADERLMPGAGVNGFRDNEEIWTRDYGTMEPGSPKSASRS